ncbi:helix-turn-helix domain-containing protein [Caldalkalibacillus mannanilyticus]|uniref:helix-turn-helix domain-containing protein n=1 Tax=Caldalkalibacillus mannanilyticus TaxID=1418 RepID=UPI000A645BE2|nr:AraC family transcriptional regulator [Caldalkalibacillus mannanilyticus]
MEVGERRQLVRSGSWFLLLAGVPYVMHVQEGVGIAYYEMTFNVVSDFVGKGESKSEEERLFWCGDISNREFFSIVNKAKQLYMGRDEEDDLGRFRLQLVFQELMYLLMQTVSVRRKGNAEEAIWSVVRFMEGHFQQALTRDRLASLAGMNQEYFSRLFKKVIGKTPKAYLTDIRINHARRELLRGNVAIEDIAEHVGFGEGYYFSRKFKQAIGMSPTEYMKKQKNKVACIFFPYIDHMLALGITPYAAMIPRTHPLASRIASSIDLGEEELDFDTRSAEILSVAEPEMILCSNYLNPDQEALLNRIAPTVSIVWDQNWRLAFREIAALMGREQEAETVFATYESRCLEARTRVLERIGEQTVALIRIHSSELRLYGGPMQGYTGPVLYGDLGLKAPSLVRSLAWNLSMVSISLDDLSMLDTDYILLVIDPDAEHHAKEIMGRPVWQELRAVRRGNVYQAGFYIWMSCGIVMNSLKLEEVIRFLGSD